MAVTYTQLGTTTLGSNQTVITFSSIPSTYTDLVIVSNFGMSSAQYPFIRFNSDSGSNYSTTDIYGNGSTALSSRESNGSKIWLNLDIPSSTTLASNFVANIQNYSNSSTYKTVIARGNVAANGTSEIVGTWRNTSAITTITLHAFGGGVAYDYITGSTFTLYGIEAA